jgi:hypothetical protein
MFVATEINFKQGTLGSIRSKVGILKTINEKENCNDMATKKAATKKASGTTAKTTKSAPSKTPAKQSSAKQSGAKQSTGKKAASKKSTGKKSTAKRSATTGVLAKTKKVAGEMILGALTGGAAGAVRGAVAPLEEAVGVEDAPPETPAKKSSRKSSAK